jgi:hypothetical protein
VLIAIVNSSGEKDNHQYNLRFLLKRRGERGTTFPSGKVGGNRRFLAKEGLEGNYVPFREGGR